jgi:hypothetical protein
MEIQGREGNNRNFRITIRTILGILIMDRLTIHAICDYFDRNMNVTIKQVAMKFNVTEDEAKKALNDQAWGDMK